MSLLDKGFYFNNLFKIGLNIHHNYKAITTDCIKKIYDFIINVNMEYLTEINKLSKDINLLEEELDRNKSIMNDMTICITNLKTRPDYDNLKFKYNELLKEYRNFRKKTNKKNRPNKKNDDDTNDDQPPAYDFI